MSMWWIFLMISGPIGLGCLLWLLITALEYWDDGTVQWPWDTFARWHEKKQPKEKGPEAGTIRIVEKMTPAGELYYVIKVWRRKETKGGELIGGYDWEVFAPWGKEVHYRTVESAQQAANDKADKDRVAAEEEAERQERAAYSKVMGEFKP